MANPQTNNESRSISAWRQFPLNYYDLIRNESSRTISKSLTLPRRVGYRRRHMRGQYSR